MFHDHVRLCFKLFPLRIILLSLNSLLNSCTPQEKYKIHIYIYIILYYNIYIYHIIYIILYYIIFYYIILYYIILYIYIYYIYIILYIILYYIYIFLYIINLARYHVKLSKNWLYYTIPIKTRCTLRIFYGDKPKSKVAHGFLSTPGPICWKSPMFKGTPSHFVLSC